MISLATVPGSPENYYKRLIDESTVGAVKTTYLGFAMYTDVTPGVTPPVAGAIWQIQKIVETTSGSDVDTEISVPVSLTSGRGSLGFEFIWNNRALLTYI